MSTIKGTWTNGQIVLQEPVDWPEGTEVTVEPAGAEQTLGIREEDWPTNAEGIARLLAQMDRIEPLAICPTADAEWQAARKAQKEYEISKFDEHARKLEELFE